MSRRITAAGVAATCASSSRSRVRVPLGVGSMKSGSVCVSSPHTAGSPEVPEAEGPVAGMPPKVSISIRVSVVSGLSATRTSSDWVPEGSMSAQVGPAA